jgi:sugar lactone lactonase YvrE
MNADRQHFLSAFISVHPRPNKGYHSRLALPQFTATPCFEPTSEELRFLPEGPRLLQNHPAGGLLLGWVAIQHGAQVQAGSINLLNLESGKNASFPLPGRPGFFAETDKPGVVLVGLERRLAYFDLLTGVLTETGPSVTGDQRVIINDGLAIDGGVLFGTKHLEFNQPLAALYFFDCAAKTVRTVIDKQFCSNGKFLRRDAEGLRLIDIDSIPKTITDYRFDSKLERLLDSSLVTSPDSLPGYPDGLRPAPDGESVIVAFYNPEPVADGAVRQIRLADGEVLCEWRIPGAPRVTCPEFVQIAGEVKLVFTTAVEGMPAETRRLAPASGTLFIASTPFHSMPEPPPLVHL